jgi:hypothetical protein
MILGKTLVGQISLIECKFPCCFILVAKLTENKTYNTSFTFDTLCAENKLDPETTLEDNQVPLKRGILQVPDGIYVLIDCNNVEFFRQRKYQISDVRIAVQQYTPCVLGTKHYFYLIFHRNEEDKANKCVEHLNQVNQSDSPRPPLRRRFFYLRSKRIRVVKPPLEEEEEGDSDSIVTQPSSPSMFVAGEEDTYSALIPKRPIPTSPRDFVNCSGSSLRLRKS